MKKTKNKKSKEHIHNKRLYLSVFFIIGLASSLFLYCILVRPWWNPFNFALMHKKYDSLQDIIRDKDFHNSRGNSEKTIFGKTIGEIKIMQESSSIEEMEILVDTILSQPSRKMQVDYICNDECVCSKAGLSTYGLYCGYRYGCSSEKPCDFLDSCCKTHDRCVGKGLLSCDCTLALAQCAYCAYTMEDGKDPSEWHCPYKDDAAVIIISDLVLWSPWCFDDENNYYTL